MRKLVVIWWHLAIDKRIILAYN